MSALCLKKLVLKHRHYIIPDPTGKELAA